MLKYAYINMKKKKDRAVKVLEKIVDLGTKPKRIQTDILSMLAKPSRKQTDIISFLEQKLN